MDKNWKILLILILTMILTGCWDYIDVNKRGYVAIVGIDKFQDETIEETDIGAKDPKDALDNRFSITYSMPNVEYIVEESEEPNIIYNAVGETFYGTNRIVTTRYDKQLNFGHLKTVIIGEEAARDEHLFREVLDAIERDPFINRRIFMLLTSESPEEILNIEPVANSVTGEFLIDLLKNQVRPARSGDGTLANIYRDLHWNRNTAIPRVIPGEDEIKVAGSGVIKDLKLIGWLGEIDTKSLQIIRGQARPENVNVRHGSGGGISGDIGSQGDHIIPVELMYLSSKFHLVEGMKDNIKLVIDVKTEGTIEEFYFQPKQSLLEPEMIDFFNKAVCEKVTQELEELIKKLQEEYRVDILGVDKYLNAYHPKLWKEVKEDWENIFPNVDIVIDTSTNIRQIGVLK